MKTVQIAPEHESVLVIEMNILLRDTRLSLPYAESYNSLFKQLTGHDHETMEWRRKTS